MTTTPKVAIIGAKEELDRLLPILRNRLHYARIKAVRDQLQDLEDQATNGKVPVDPEHLEQMGSIVKYTCLNGGIEQGYHAVAVDAGLAMREMILQAETTIE